MKLFKNQFIGICCISLLFTCVFYEATAQVTEKLGLDVDKWAVRLTKGDLNEVNSLGSLTTMLVQADSTRALQFLDSLETSKKAKGYFFKTFFCMVKADVLYLKFAGYDKFKNRESKELLPIKEQLMKLYATALDAAYHTEKDITIGWVNFYSAKRMRDFGETGWAVMYAKNGVDIFEKVNYPVEPPVYTDFAELLLQVKEYDESIMYARKGIAAWKLLNYEKEYKDPYKFKIKAYNIIGSNFYEKNLYDSAAANYREALKIANQNNDTVLAGKVLGNTGRLFYAQNKYDSAWGLFKNDYYYSKYDSVFHEAAHASQWMAKASLAKGNRASALAEAKEALRLLNIWPNKQFLRDTYFTLTDIYRAMGVYDSAFYYADRYRILNDSIEKEVVTSSLAVSKAKLNSEESRYNIQKIKKEKKEQLLIRNSLIAAIILLFIIVLLAMNRGRLKHKMAVEKAEREKIIMEQEIRLAKEQMNSFTSNAIEKTNLIEKLELQINDSRASTDQSAIMAQLMELTILTEEDWIRFKTLFEKIYPHFFQELKRTAADITLAEQRMAVLTRLQLTSKQMAAMLGISVDSVHKTRQRLRQRLQLNAEMNLDDYIAGI